MLVSSPGHVIEKNPNKKEKFILSFDFIFNIRYDEISATLRLTEEQVAEKEKILIQRNDTIKSLEEEKNYLFNTHTSFQTSLSIFYSSMKTVKREFCVTRRRSPHRT